MTRPDARDGIDWHLIAALVALFAAAAFLAHLTGGAS